MTALHITNEIHHNVQVLTRSRFILCWCRFIVDLKSIKAKKPSRWKKNKKPIAFEFQLLQFPIDKRWSDIERSLALVFVLFFPPLRLCNSSCFRFGRFLFRSSNSGRLYNRGRWKLHWRMPSMKTSKSSDRSDRIFFFFKRRANKRKIWPSRHAQRAVYSLV